MWLASACALMGDTHCKCHSSERKSSLTQKICWERHKRMAASAWERSSKELNRRQAFHRVSWDRVELSRMAWDWKDFDGLGLEGFCDLVLVCLFVCFCRRGPGSPASEGDGPGSQSSRLLSTGLFCIDPVQSWGLFCCSVQHRMLRPSLCVRLSRLYHDSAYWLILNTVEKPLENQCLNSFLELNPALETIGGHSYVEFCSSGTDKSLISGMKDLGKQSCF